MSRGIKSPAVLGEFGNSTEQAYTGWRSHLFDRLARSCRLWQKALPAARTRFGYSVVSQCS